MDDASDMKPMVEDLRDSIDELENALAPLLRSNHIDITSKLPLLDKAKLSVLTTYAIESILFFLKLSSVDAKQHPIFAELARVKQYFEKIKDSEDGGPAKRANLRLNAPAANRFIKAALAGNDRFDKQRAERQAVEKQGALTKLDNMDVTPVSSSKIPSKKRKADAELAAESSPPKTPRVEGVISGEAHEKRNEATDEHDPELLDTSPKPAVDDAEAAAKRELKKAKKERKREKENGADGMVRRHSKHSASKNYKSSKPPRDTKSVFRDLLNGKEHTVSS